MAQEPTILDYLKSLVKPGERIDLAAFFNRGPRDRGMAEACPANLEGASQQPLSGKSPAYLVAGFLAAVFAQFQLEPPRPSPLSALIIYSAAAVLIILGIKSGESSPRFRALTPEIGSMPLKIKRVPFLAGIFLLLAAFIIFGGNLFTSANLGLWLSGGILFIWSVWQPEKKRIVTKSDPSNLPIAAMAVVAITLFFRFFRLASVPAEMFSDHAEKLLDVMDVLAGKFPIFFIRNTGREALQFYLTATIIKIFNTGITFESLKIGAMATGFITLFYIYRLGRELSGKWLGLGAAFFAGIAYWPNVISRVGLRFPFYPLFVAPVLVYTFLGLRKRRFNPLVLAGLFLGAGLHGYSPIRVLPLLIAVIFLLFVLSNHSRADKRFAFTGFILLAACALVVFLPLLRYLLENPVGFNYRLISRLTSFENPINGPVGLIFVQNLAKSLIMFFYNNGVVWVNSIPNRPALDVVSAVFLFVGLIHILYQVVKRETDWRELSLLLSIPILMLPSILSLAFPSENPSLNRSSGAVAPIFFLVSYGFFTIFNWFMNKERPWQKRILGLLILSTSLIASLASNYQLVFDTYAGQFLLNAWNSSEIGAQVAEFVEGGNQVGNVFVVPYPHWVDTRLVGINAGYPGKDFALWPQELAVTVSLPGDKLFIIKPEDISSLDIIKSFYPGAQEEIFYSRTPGKDFIKVYVEE